MAHVITSVIHKVAQSLLTIRALNSEHYAKWSLQNPQHDPRWRNQNILVLGV